jgi:hypothetical protein
MSEMKRPPGQGGRNEDEAAAKPASTSNLSTACNSPTSRQALHSLVARPRLTAPTEGACSVNAFATVAAKYATKDITVCPLGLDDEGKPKARLDRFGTRFRPTDNASPHLGARHC